MAEKTVQIVRPNLTDHRDREVRQWTVGFLVVKSVATACALVPIVDDVVTALVIAAIVAVVGGLIVRWVARRARWWFEDRADARTAAAWRAEHGAPTRTVADLVEHAGVTR